MSNKVNDRILDEIRELGDLVQFHRDYWTGKPMDDDLEKAYLEAIKTLNTTRVNELLKKSSERMFELEYAPTIAEYKQEHPKSTIKFDGMEVPF